MMSFKSVALAGLTTAALTFSATAANAASTVFKGYDANTSGNRGLATNPNATAASAAFNSQLSGVSTESFESFTTGRTAPLTLNFTGSAGALSATLTGNGSVESAPRSNPTSSGQYATDGSKYYEVDSSNFTVNFGSTPVSAFGFFATDLESASGINFRINFTGGGFEDYNLQSLFGTTGTLPSGSVHFLGFINTTNSFSSVVFGGQGAVGDILAFDQMTIGDRSQVTGGVPEPTTWAMMIGGFGAIGVAARRRRRTTVSFA